MYKKIKMMTEGEKIDKMVCKYAWTDDKSKLITYMKIRLRCKIQSL